jgi:nitrogen regulatory protein P-II 1
MKLIIAYVKPERFKEVKKELFRAEVTKMSVSKARGCGQQQGFTEIFRGTVQEVTLLPKIRIEIAVNDSFVEKTVGAIIKGARTDEVGDGKIFVLPLDDCVRIRTGERGMAAIGGSSAELERERSIAFSKTMGKSKSG